MFKHVVAVIPLHTFTPQALQAARCGTRVPEKSTSPPRRYVNNSRIISRNILLIKYNILQNSDNRKTVGLYSYLYVQEHVVPTAHLQLGDSPAAARGPGDSKNQLTYGDEPLEPWMDRTGPRAAGVASPGRDLWPHAAPYSRTRMRAPRLLTDLNFSDLRII